VNHSWAILGEIPAVVFVNPVSGGGRALDHLNAIRDLFRARKIPAEFSLTETAHDLESRIFGAIADGRRLLFAMGGDGTFQILVNAAYGRDVLLGVLPAGGGNDFAAALGLPKEPLAAARAVLSGVPRSVDLIRATTGDGRSRLYVGGGGVGVDVEAARHAEATYRRLPGRLRYIPSALRALREFKPPRVRADFPDGDAPTIGGEFLLAAAFNTPSYGAGVRLAPHAKIDDGLLDVAFVKKLGTLEIASALPGLMLSGTLRDVHLKRARARRVIFSSDPLCPFHGDGEIFGPTPVAIEVIPQAIRVLSPVAAN
jgi:diacylglycerol kinase (ATP)